MRLLEPGVHTFVAYDDKLRGEIACVRHFKCKDFEFGWPMRFVEGFDWPKMPTTFTGLVMFLSEVYIENHQSQIKIFSFELQKVGPITSGSLYYLSPPQDYFNWLEGVKKECVLLGGTPT